MLKQVRCPVKRVLTSLDALQKRSKTSRDYFWIGEIKNIVTKISKGIGTKKTLNRLFDTIEDGLSNLSFESSFQLKLIRKDIKENLKIFENHLELKSCVFEDCELLTPAPCQLACPADIDIPTFVALISQKRYREAVEVIRKDNPFPWICGLVCTHPCESACIRGKIDKPVSIMTLKSFAVEMALSKDGYKNPPKMPDNGRKVCIIGSGPAGLTCAFYLALLGYRITIIEALPVVGGMMRVGIPAYRLPREIIDKEVERIRELGVEFRLNTKFGRDVSFESLKKEGFEAFMISIGAHDCYRLNIEGEDLYPQVLSAVDFLREVNLGNMKKPGDRVVIVGGGNVAIDAARTCVRLGCREVIIAYRRTEDQMPAHPTEIKEAKEEGVKFLFLTIPKKIVGKDKRLTGMVCLKAELKGRDRSGRPRPVAIEGSDFIIEADAVIAAIGQRVDRSCVEDVVCPPCSLEDRENIESLQPLEWTDRNTIKIVNPATMQTNLMGVFASGDVVLGPATVVEAIGQGKRAAYGIHRYLQGQSQPLYAPFPQRRGREGFVYISADEKQNTKRAEEDLLEIEKRKTTFQQVHLGFKEEDGVNEAKRCLRCDVCIRCGRCVEVCRFEVGVNALHFGHITGESDTKLYLAQDLCIGCGSCVRACPTGAMRLEDAGEFRIISICGTVLAKLPLVSCKECGRIIGTKRYIEFVKFKLRDQVGLRYGDLCSACLRKKEAQNLSVLAN